MEFPFAVVRKALLFLIFVCHSVLVSITSVTLARSGGVFPAIPFVTAILGWLAIVILVLFLIDQYIHREKKSSIRNMKAIYVFACLSLTSFAASVHAIIRVEDHGLCGDFSGMMNPCATASSVLVMSWLATLSAFIGIIVSYLGISSLYKVTPFRTDFEANKFQMKYPEDIYQASVQSRYRNDDTKWDPDRFVTSSLFNLNGEP